MQPSSSSSEPEPEIIEGQLVVPYSDEDIARWRAAMARQRKFEWALHIFMLAFCLFILAMSFMMRSVGPSMVFFPGSAMPLPDSCYSRVLFGFDCPGCGLTRCFISISSGQFQRAFAFNWAGFFVYAFVVSQIPWRIIQLVRMAKGKSAIDSPWLYSVPAVVMLALLIHWAQAML